MGNNTQSLPLVIVGLDAGDPDLIQRWTQEGYLPTIASIMQRGCWGRISGPDLISTKGTWLSLFSGISRSEHGYYFNRQLKPGTYDCQRVTAQDAHALPFWWYLRGGSKKVAIIDAPDTYALMGVPGIQIADWATQQEYNTAARPVSAKPASFLEDVHRLVGQKILIDAFKPNSHVHQDLEAYRLLLKRVEQKGMLCCHFVTRDAYDLVVVGLVEAHTAAHRLWDYRPEGARHSDAANENSELSNAIRDVYQAIDREIGLLLEQLTDKANIFITSLLGMKDQYPTNGLIAAFCRQLGYQSASGRAWGTVTPLAAIRRITPPQWRVSISRLLPVRMQEWLQADQFCNETHWGKTTAFPLPSLNTSFVRVNLRGREPHGIVEPGSEYESLLDRLEADLRQLVEMRTGEPAVEKVTRTVEAFRCGPPLVLPDLFIEWKASPHFMERVAHSKVELVQAKQWYHRSSYHSFSGFVAAAGPSIQARGSIGEVSLLDLAPTFLALMGEPIPQKLTGKVMETIIT